MAQKNYPSGDKHPRSKLSSKDVLDIRRKYDRGNVTYRGLAKQYSVGCTTISDVLNNRTWRGPTND